MSSSSFLLSPHVPLVADASVVINLNGSGRAADIIRAAGSSFFVTENAAAGLASGSIKGHRDYEQLRKLIDSGHIHLASLKSTGLRLYEPLIDGSTVTTLDDGEAATIACASEISGVALIDERKARTLCRNSFPKLPVLCTVELLMHELIAQRLGQEFQIEAIVNALNMTRMRVPQELVGSVVTLIGTERAAQCPSLPKLVRQPAA